MQKCIIYLFLVLWLFFGTNLSAFENELQEALSQGEIKKALSISEKIYQEYSEHFGPDHANTATAIENHASLLRLDNQFQLSEQWLLRAIKIRKKNSLEYARSLVDLAHLYILTGKIVKANEMIAQALLVLDKKKDEYPSDYVNALNLQISILLDSGNYKKAQKSISEALSYLKKLDQNSTDTTSLSVAILLQDAALKQSTGELEDARKILLHVLEIQNTVLESGHPNFVITFNNLGELATQAGDYQQAITFFLKALKYFNTEEKTLSENYAVLIANLAEAQFLSGEYEVAINLLNKALDIQRSIFGSSSSQTIPVMSKLVGIYYLAEQYSKALEYINSILKIQKMQSGRRIDMAEILANRAEILRKKNQLAAALKDFNQAVALIERTKGDESIELLNTLINRAALKRQLKDYSQSNIDYNRALKISLSRLNENNAYFTEIYYGLARNYSQLTNIQKSLLSYEKALQIIKQQFVQDKRFNDLGTLREVKSNRKIIEDYLALLVKQRQPGVFEQDVFQAFQLAKVNATSLAATAMGIVKSKALSELGDLVKQRDQLEKQAKSLEKKFLLAAETEQARHRKNFDQIKNKIQQLNRQLQDDYPRYASLADLKLVSLETLQPLLMNDELILSYLVADDNLYVYFFDKNTAGFSRLDISRAELSDLVAQLRAQFDVSKIASLDNYDPQYARQLFKKLLMPIASRLKLKKRMIIFPDRELFQVPFEVFLTQDVDGSRSVSSYPFWVREVAISYLPSLSSFYSLRKYTTPSAAKLAFLGIGNPELDSTQFAAYEKQQAVKLSRSQRIARQVSLFEPLPETEEELNQIARFYQVDADNLYVKREANEKNIKTSINLKNYKVISFATHGVMAGEVKDFDLPGLVLSPPDKPEGDNDGYLTTREIAELELDADLVMLSACNTASSNTTEEPDSLSGLVKAFIQAGARSLLVSHWAVLSDATVLLTTETIRNLKSFPELSLSQAHQKSMNKLLNKSRFSHPVNWAPFVVIGDGR